jgi:Zn-dependent peptidase ImmA (M78 family)
MNDFVLEKSAAAFRAGNGLGSTDSIRLKSLLQKLNVITVFSPLSGNFSGMALKADTDTRFMLVNSTQSLGKQHFTICHELFHLYVQENFSSQVCHTGTFNKSDKNEYYADVFASYLLLPTEGLTAHIPNEELEKKKISLSTILFIENFYSCSRRALLYRLRNLKLISSDEYEAYATNVKRGALQNGYFTDLYEAGNDKVVIGDYGSVARSLFDKENISESHYYSLLADLGIDVTKIDDSTGAED